MPGTLLPNRSTAETWMGSDLCGTRCHPNSAEVIEHNSQEVSTGQERPKGQLFSSVLEEFSSCTMQVRGEGTKQPLHLAEEDTCEHITDSATKISNLNSQDSLFWFPVSINSSFVLYQSSALYSQQWRITPDSHLFLCCFISHVLGETSVLPVPECRKTSQAVNVHEPPLSVVMLCLLHAWDCFPKGAPNLPGGAGHRAPEQA